MRSGAAQRPGARPDGLALCPRRPGRRLPREAALRPHRDARRAFSEEPRVDLQYGFVSICLSEQACSPAGNVTVKQAEALDPPARRSRILRTARRNLENTLRIMWFLRAHGLELYRISANLIPLATHPVTAGWAWWEEEDLRQLGAKIGEAAARQGYRLSSHLPELCGFTTEAGFHWTQRYLEYHRRLFELLNFGPSAKIVMHVGGAGGGKAQALKTAKERIVSLSPWARERLVLENDDRVFTAADVVQLAEETGVPVAFDWHHHWVNRDGEAEGPAVRRLLARGFALWRDRPPKVHVSSPREGRNPRAHADYVDPRFVLPFLEMAREAGARQLDVMVEAKMKDLAALRLRDQVAPVFSS
ncbi:MAG: UV DNA damage repair endonuclease UvsE [Firmicutes bacterium]|nr:UV DNA damage repair endonuclease UvsE [Bacillota bacterium]